ncbi:MAG: hypothetical protein WC364_04150 [Eubacteriales bacterium]
MSDRHGIITAYSGASLRQRHGLLWTGLAVLQRRLKPLVSHRCPVLPSLRRLLLPALRKSFAVENAVPFGWFYYTFLFILLLAPLLVFKSL